ncbi:ATP-grasp domain-containing protein [Lysinibacillus xylanilyticus]|uniref:ATP-grasp domain-containing protein n=1 Tax=Lysinibacillus xylanilyticus TaxID=582475 RepID=UPI003CFC4E6F
MITGIAGDIGRSIAEILKNAFKDIEIIGTDIDKNFPYKLYCNNFVEGMPFSNPDYLKFLEEYVSKSQLLCIIPTSELEIRFFNEKRISHILDVPLIMASNNIMDIGFDKLKTIHFLSENNLPYPETILAKDFNYNLQLPCIAKSRTGAGSKEIFIVNTENFQSIIEKYPEWIFQELLLPENEEYTCGIFKSKKGIVKTITLKRTLKGGRTGYAEVVDNELINSLLFQVADSIKFNGSINIQLRLSGGEPKIFEINPRFSSTVKFRDMLGFKDLLWSIQDVIGEINEIDYNVNEIIGKKLYRADKEIIY